jgi:DNA polymerase-3 subunit delta
VKIDPRRTEAFLRDPGACRAVLLHGEDVGLIRERARTLAVLVAGSADDPFRVVELEQVGQIPDEFASRSLTGGRRVLRVRDATDTATAAVERALAGPGEAFLILEGAGLGTRSRLVKAMGDHPQAAAIACYPLEGRDLGVVIRTQLGEAGLRVDDDAIAFLIDHLGADLAVTHREIEKLTLYVGKEGLVDLAAAQICVGDLAGLSLENALYAAMTGDIAGADRALELAMAEGSSSVGVLRQALMHLQRLHRARLAMAGGLSAQATVDAMRPPVFFRRKPSMVAALGLWTEPALAAACQRVWDAERACKRTGAADEALCRSAVIGLAQRAAAARRRGA